MPRREQIAELKEIAVQRLLTAYPGFTQKLAKSEVDNSFARIAEGGFPDNPDEEAADEIVNKLLFDTMIWNKRGPRSRANAGRPLKSARSTGMFSKTGKQLATLAKKGNVAAQREIARRRRK